MPAFRYVCEFATNIVTIGSGSVGGTGTVFKVRQVRVQLRQVRCSRLDRYGVQN